MGLFKKKATVEPTDFLALRAELVELRGRVEVAEQENAALLDRIASLDASTTALAASHPELSNLDHLRDQIDAVSVRINQVDTKLVGLHDDVVDLHEQAARAATAPPPPPPPPPPPAAIDHHADPELVARIEEAHDRLTQFDTVQAQLQQLTARVAAQAEMGAQLSGLRDRLTQLGDQVATTEGLREHVQQLAQRSRSADEFGALMQQLSERLDRTEVAQQQTVGSLDAIDARIDQRIAARTPEAVQTQVDALRQHVEDRLGSVGTELANQISELGRDLDALAASNTDTADPSSLIDVDALIHELRGGQVRLANEQARYEIAFRQDLAALAEQLRRPR